LRGEHHISVLSWEDVSQLPHCIQTDFEGDVKVSVKFFLKIRRWWSSKIALVLFSAEDLLQLALRPALMIWAKDISTQHVRDESEPNPCPLAAMLLASNTEAANSLLGFISQKIHMILKKIKNNEKRK
jgi:hypothetical protein